MEQIKQNIKGCVVVNRAWYQRISVKVSVSSLCGGPVSPFRPCSPLEAAKLSLCTLLSVTAAELAAGALKVLKFDPTGRETLWVLVLISVLTHQQADKRGTMLAI